MSKKYSKRFNEDYDFYYRHRHKFTFGYGDKCQLCIQDDDGCSAKKAFYIYDSQGKVVDRCREKALLIEIVTCKAGINVQIMEWAEGFNDVIEPFSVYMKEFDNPPKWVEHSLRERTDKQFKKLLKHPDKAGGLIGLIMNRWYDKS